jgi:hypothetical protein
LMIKVCEISFFVSTLIIAGDIWDKLAWYQKLSVNHYNILPR